MRRWEGEHWREGGEERVEEASKGTTRTKTQVS